MDGDDVYHQHPIEQVARTNKAFILPLHLENHKIDKRKTQFLIDFSSWLG